MIHSDIRRCQWSRTFSLLQAISVDDRYLADDIDSFDEKTTCLGGRLLCQRPKNVRPLILFRLLRLLTYFIWQRTAQDRHTWRRHAEAFTQPRGIALPNDHETKTTPDRILNDLIVQAYTYTRIFVFTV